MNDKRNYRRFSFENSIFLKFENNPTEIIEGKLLDISFVGLSIFLKEDIKVDAIAQGTVHFNTSCFPEQHLTGKGQVVSIRKHRLYAQDGFRIGVKFVEVDKEAVINSINRLESKILEQIRRQSQAPRKNPELF